jgi:hypothetical protein
MDANNRRVNNRRTICKSMGASKSMVYTARAWTPVTVGPTTEEQSVTAWARASKSMDNGKSMDASVTVRPTTEETPATAWAQQHH